MTPYTLFSLDGNTGSLVSTFTYSQLQANFQETRFLFSPDQTALFLSAVKNGGSGYGQLWKLDLTSPGFDVTCLEINNIPAPLLAIVVLSNTEVFVVTGKTSSSRHSAFKKVDFSTESVIWNKFISCHTTYWNLYNFASIASPDKQTLYTLTGSQTKIFFQIFNAADGSVKCINGECSR